MCQCAPVGTSPINGQIYYYNSVHGRLNAHKLQEGSSFKHFNLKRRFSLNNVLKRLLKFKFKNPQLSFLSLNIYILLYSKKRKKIYDLNILKICGKKPKHICGLLPRERFLDPPPRPLSILYTDLKCKTCGRSARPPSLSWSQHSAQKVS